MTGPCELKADAVRPPLISIVMPVGQIDRYLPQTLASIAAQTLRDFELVAVCDEKLAHELREALTSMATTYPWRVVTTQMKGLAFALNVGIAEAAGEYVARWDADDLCGPTRLERQIETFRAKPRLVAIGTRAILIDEDGKTIAFHKFHFYDSNAKIRRALKYRQAIVHSSLMMRRAKLLESGAYRLGCASEDHAMFLRLARDPVAEFENLGDVVCGYRRHSGQLSSNSKKYEQFCDIAGFMTTEFFRTGHPLYLVGVIANVPIVRGLRHFARISRSIIAKLFAL